MKIIELDDGFMIDISQVIAISELQTIGVDVMSGELQTVPVKKTFYQYVLWVNGGVIYRKSEKYEEMFAQRKLIVEKWNEKKKE